MKYTKGIFKILSTALGCLFAFGTLAACGDNTNSNEITVTYDYNYEGAPAAVTEKIEKGDVATEPDDPIREHYAFTGWYSDESATDKFDFEYSIDEDLTIYAGWRLTEVVVTFDYGYDNKTETEIVSVGAAVGEPSIPSRDGYSFSGWFESATATESYDFTTVLSSDTTLIAKWTERDTDSVEIKFMWNYEDAPNNGVYGNMYTRTGRVLTTALPQPSRGDNYYFYGWYTDAEFTRQVTQTEKYSSDTTLYARWYDRYTFEAEYTAIKDKTGAGYSGLAGGYNLIVHDTFNAETSKEDNDGYFVTYLYYNKASLEFYINAEEDIDDAVLYLRLSCEIKDLYLTSNDFLVRVGTFNSDNVLVDLDGNPLQEKVGDTTVYKGSYSFNPIDIKITVEGANTGYSDVSKQPFANFLITTKLKLKKGLNIIQLMVNNDTYIAGTMNATSPIYDCLYIYSDKHVSWDTDSGYPIKENLLYVPD